MKAWRTLALVAAGCVASVAGAAEGPATAVQGLTAVESPHSVKKTMDRFESAAKSRGLMIFLRVDHAAGAKKIGKDLRPTELVVFGNPQGGTPLMECAQTTGIDLPLKALAWKDAAGKVWIAYNDPAYLAARHGADNCEAVTQMLTKALASLTQEAIKP